MTRIAPPSAGVDGRADRAVDGRRISGVGR